MDQGRARRIERVGLVAVRPFSIRHRKAIFDKKVPVSVSGRLRRRIWKLVEHYDHEVWTQPDPTDNWNERSCASAEVEAELKRLYGEDNLTAFDPPEGKTRQQVTLKGFVLGAYPTQVLDVIELFHEGLIDHQDRKHEFQWEINTAFEEEECPWRLCEGQFFKVDSAFLAVQVMERSQELLKEQGIGGALDELLSARNDLTAADFKGAIINACKAFESTLKWVLDRDTGNASVLLKAFVEEGYCDDLPEAIRPGFRESVLSALPFLRNRLGGHGQGGDVVEVTRPYAELAVHLAGTFIQFTVAKVLERRPSKEEQEPAATTGDDEIPF